MPAAAVDELGYTVTEEWQNLVDDELGACIRYLAVKVSYSLNAVKRLPRGRCRTSRAFGFRA